MRSIGVEALEAGEFYWACRKVDHGGAKATDRKIEVVQVSTVFGSAAEFWTVAIMGSDEHFDLDAFEFFYRVPSPPISNVRHANSNFINAGSRRLSS